ncbi:hypothetical protein [Saliphagus infecundisoli]|uniref:Uncharacterized protein n=1 Tax=Saliphagus infecundisoli TaxID=1849069 RepID=A0ABD5QJ44_9EURY|nr:hypothetical protein [Saliphagus infecundisoli]
MFPLLPSGSLSPLPGADNFVARRALGKRRSLVAFLVLDQDLPGSYYRSTDRAITDRRVFWVCVHSRERGAMERVIPIQGSIRTILLLYLKPDPSTLKVKPAASNLSGNWVKGNLHAPNVQTTLDRHILPSKGKLVRPSAEKDVQNPLIRQIGIIPLVIRRLLQLLQHRMKRQHKEQDLSRCNVLVKIRIKIPVHNLVPMIIERIQVIIKQTFWRNPIIRIVPILQHLLLRSPVIGLIPLIIVVYTLIPFT